MQGTTGDTKARGIEYKGVDGCIKTVAICGHKKVAAVHGAAGGAQAAAAGVLKRFTGRQQRLLSDPRPNLLLPRCVLGRPG